MCLIMSGYCTVLCEVEKPDAQTNWQGPGYGTGGMANCPTGNKVDKVVCRV
jgi:hypothetical protein